jgi:hypothetical protein
VAFNATANPLFQLHPVGLVDTSNPIYGSSNPDFTNFVAPGILITIGFAQAIGLTAISFIQVSLALFRSRVRRVSFSFNVVLHGDDDFRGFLTTPSSMPRTVSKQQSTGPKGWTFGQMLGGRDPPNLGDHGAPAHAVDGSDRAGE